MREPVVLAQLIIAMGIAYVWVFRFGKPTPFRPEGANNMAEEFRRYGFPDWVRKATGAAKLSLAVLLVVGIWFPTLAAGAAAGMAVLMLVAVLAHVRVSDPPVKAAPALAMLVLSAFVAVSNGLL